MEYFINFLISIFVKIAIQLKDDYIKRKLRIGKYRQSTINDNYSINESFPKARYNRRQAAILIHAYAYRFSQLTSI